MEQRTWNCKNCDADNALCNCDNQKIKELEDRYQELKLFLSAVKVDFQDKYPVLGHRIDELLNPKPKGE